MTQPDKTTLADWLDEYAALRKLESDYISAARLREAAAALRSADGMRYETTDAGVIDWKMEAERANRLYAQAEQVRSEALEAFQTIQGHCDTDIVLVYQIAGAMIDRLAAPSVKTSDQ